MESEQKPQEEEVQQSSPEKKHASDAADAPQLPPGSPPSPGLSNQQPASEDSHLGSAVSQQSAEASDVSKEGTEIGSQPGRGGTTGLEAKSGVSEAQMGTVSESVVVVVKGNEISKSQEAAEEKNATDVLSEDSKEVETNLISRSAPETTNVLKLETEIRNEYYQAPPLGQTLTFQAHKSKFDKDNSPPNEMNEDVAEEPEKPSRISKAVTAEPEQKDAGASVCDVVETKKVAELPCEKNSPVRQVLNALQSLSSHSRQSPDTADSDDSPSALEMEDIPAGITCVTAEDIKERPLAGLAAPPISFALREKMASADLASDHHLDTACNTSPEGGLSEEEPELENVLTEADSAEVGGGAKHDESSEEQTYSVSDTHDTQAHLCSS